jgi:hypothetical protein
MAGCGRARRKIGNEHNSVLKHNGYHLEHNVETKFPTGMGGNTPVKSMRY